MPIISEFYGIVIAIFYKDHNPPHFHARYGEYEAKVTLQNPEIIEGFLPAHAKSLVLEWARNHESELQADWELARNHKPLLPIEPLE